ncbi:hypothetical protein N8310_05205 [Pseudomonadota bacterium]|nr:hypothetical protein [Pseudomonadota bacterium]
MKEKSLGYLAIFLVIFPLIYNILHYWEISALNSWQASEWLISYSGGFVRRGFGGEIIFLISNLFSISPSIPIVVISFFSYLLLVVILIKITRNIIPLYILFSPILLGMPVYNNFLIRKDILGVLFLIISLLLMKRNLNISTLIIINIISILAILNHEAFIFFGLPIIMLTFNLLEKQKIWHPFILIKLSPTLLVCILVIFFHGNQDISMKIFQTWNSWIYDKFSYCCMLKKDYAIDALATSIQGPMGLSKSVLYHWAGWILYVPLVWLISLCVSALILGQLALNDNSIRYTFYILFLIQTIFVFPLFVIGWDFGRWIFFILISSISWVSIFQDTLTKPYQTTNFNFQKFTFTIRRRNRIAIFLLFFSIPSCCWTLQSYIKNTPFFSNYNIFSEVITGYNLKEQHQLLIKFLKKY